MEESKPKNLTIMEMESRLSQVTYMVGERGFNIELAQAEQKRDHQEILDLKNKIIQAKAKHKQEDEAEKPALLKAIEDAETVDPTTPKVS